MLQVKIKKKLGNFLLDVDFSMDGGVFAILGASGCGKSMTLKCIAGIERPDEGRIVLNDRVLFDSEKRINLPPQKRKVGYMFQDYALFPNMNVVQNIQAGDGKKAGSEESQRVYHRISAWRTGKSHAGSALRRTKTACGDGTYAGFGAGSALLDEPFAALDSYLKWKMEQQMLELLQEVQKPGTFRYHTAEMRSTGCVIRSAVSTRDGWK